MVLPVPVAPVMSPCLFAMRASRHSCRPSASSVTGFSAAAMKSLLSEVNMAVSFAGGGNGGGNGVFGNASGICFCAEG